MDVRSVARHKQHATEQLSTKSYTNILKNILFGLQRHDPHLRRLRQRGVLGSAFRRETQAACGGTAFYKKAIPTTFLRKHCRRLKGRPVGSQNSYGSCCIKFLPKQKIRKKQASFKSHCCGWQNSLQRSKQKQLVSFSFCFPFDLNDLSNSVCRSRHARLPDVFKTGQAVQGTR